MDWLCYPPRKQRFFRCKVAIQLKDVTVLLCLHKSQASQKMHVISERCNGYRRPPCGGRTGASALFPMRYGPEYFSGKLLAWAQKRGISIQYIQPEKSQKTAYVERYNRTARHEQLDQHIITSIEEAQNAELRRTMAMDA